MDTNARTTSAIRTVLCLGLLGVPTLPLADDVTGASRILCAAQHATRCTGGLGCETGDPTDWNIPDFIEIDLVEKQLRSTASSADKRLTSFSTLDQVAGTTYVQGIDKGRAFSIVIDQRTGELTAATARAGTAVSIFARCTPLSSPVSR